MDHVAGGYRNGTRERPGEHDLTGFEIRVDRRQRFCQISGQLAESAPSG
jgi:hypothetical protein